MNKAEFFWGMIGNASPEPVAVVIENGTRVAYTCGCADPLLVDGPGAAVKLICPDPGEDPPGTHPQAYLDLPDVRPMEIPPKPRERARQIAARERAYREYRAHGWRKFNP